MSNETKTAAVGERYRRCKDGKLFEVVERYRGWDYTWWIKLRPVDGGSKSALMEHSLFVLYDRRSGGAS